ncbi:MAG: prepilin-type N-terminal cleavage/methylation domain-containing protein [Kiritimatiellae bacterium]|nr:prepilin-type N-terminal cleavage/methylation domain-containing protein [Kiritimatiellia bacterium]
MKQGFTFIEVMVALAILTIMVFVVGTSLITILKAEETARRTQQSALLIQRLSTRHFIHKEIDDVFRNEYPDWNFASKSIDPVGIEKDEWFVWTLTKKNQSQSINIKFKKFPLDPRS